MLEHDSTILITIEDRNFLALILFARLVYERLLAPIFPHVKQSDCANETDLINKTIFKYF